MANSNDSKVEDHLMQEMLKPFDEQSLVDADLITQRMFGCSCRGILQRILDNPLRRDSGESAGDVAYQDGELMGFQAAIARRLYWNGKPLIGIVGSTLGMRPEASPVLLMHLMKKTMAPRVERKFFFANTSNLQSMKMNKMLGIDGEGPESCAFIRFAVTYWPRWLRLVLPEPSARVIGINEEEIDVFWRGYLATSSGLVSSRSGKEMVAL